MARWELEREFPSSFLYTVTNKRPYLQQGGKWQPTSKAMFCPHVCYDTHAPTVAHMHTRARNSYSKSCRIINWHTPLVQGAPCVKESGQVAELEPNGIGKQHREDLFAHLAT